MCNVATAEDFNKLFSELQDIKFMLTIADIRLPKVVTVKDIAKAENISKTQLYTKEKYLLPNFAVSDFPDGSIRWNLETYLAWRKIPVSERKQMYAEHLERVRKSNLAEMKKVGKCNAPTDQR